jgi:hypothetical protein
MVQSWLEKFSRLLWRGRVPCLRAPDQPVFLPQLVPQEVVAAFPRAMLNIHPGFLPTFGGKGFYGSRVHKAVIASGVRFTGAPPEVPKIPGEFPDNFLMNSSDFI